MLLTMLASLVGWWMGGCAVLSAIEFAVVAVDDETGERKEVSPWLVYAAWPYFLAVGEGRDRG